MGFDVWLRDISGSNAAWLESFVKSKIPLANGAFEIVIQTTETSDERKFR